MNTHPLAAGLAAALTILALEACAGADNPTALADLNTEVEVELAVAEIQTLEEVEFHLHIAESGMHLQLERGEIEVRHHDAGTSQTVTLESDGDEYHARVTFFEPGEHHIHVMGMPRGNTIMGELYEFEVEVERRHETIGPYLVEIATDPAGPMLEGETAHIHLNIYDFLPDGTKGAPATGLPIAVEVHAPDGTEVAPSVIEEDAGEYELEVTFGEHGVYELHVEMALASGDVSGEFDIPIFSPDPTEEDEQDEAGGHGHDH